jgi:hypothetical protein
MSYYYVLVACVVSGMLSILWYKMLISRPMCPPHELEECYDESNDFSDHVIHFNPKTTQALEASRVHKKIYRGHICLRCGARFMLAQGGTDEASKGG